MDVESSRKSAVSFDQVYTTYRMGRLKKKTQVLKDVSLNVLQGTIFGLLGPSGCGKTTVLKCVIGRLKPDQGTVKVFNHTAGSAASKIPGSSVGYMPQELALYRNLTIDETMHFFGRLHCMKTQDVKSRIEFLLEFLNLPRTKKLVKNYSGGEQRRISFAIALLHQPPLLILDEPTVGVDPILRKNIWNYLIKISSDENVTVIITTHYIEEARRANKIALMRSGSVLAQDEPEALLNQHNAASLEDVFLLLCQKVPPKQNGVGVYEKINDEFVQPQLSNGVTQENNSDQQHKLQNCMDNLKPPSLKKIRALTILNFIKMWRNYMIVLFQFLSPVIQTLVFYWALGTQPKNLNVAVFNQDNVLGTKYLHHINNATIHQIAVNSTDQGEDLVLDGKAWAVLTILPNFTTALITRLISHKNLSNDTLLAGTVFVRYDNTDQLITLTLQEALYTAFNDFANDAVHKFDKTMQLPTLPVQFGEPIYGPVKGRFIDFMTPGMLATLPFFLAVSLTAVSYVNDKTEGLLDRVYVSGASSFEVLCGHIFTQSGVIVIQVSVLIVMATQLFGVENKGSYGWLILLACMQGFSGMTCGFLISTVSSNATAAMMLAMGLFMPLLLTCGSIWPIEGMSTFLRYIAQFQPMTLPNIAMIWIILHGKDIAFPAVWIGFSVSLTCILAFVILSVLVMKIKK